MCPLDAFLKPSKAYLLVLACKFLLRPESHQELKQHRWVHMGTHVPLPKINVKAGSHENSNLSFLYHEWFRAIHSQRSYAQIMRFSLFCENCLKLDFLLLHRSTQCTD